MRSKARMLKDSRQLAVYYDTFSIDPSTVLKVTSEEDTPKPAAADHVIIKVQVRNSWKHFYFVRALGQSYDSVGFVCNRRRL
jgi:hypothetical protein